MASPVGLPSASFPDSTPQLFTALCIRAHSAIKSSGVESGNEARFTKGVLNNSFTIFFL